MSETPRFSDLTSQERCELLARAMGWTTEQVPAVPQEPRSVLVTIWKRPDGQPRPIGENSMRCPNPFQNPSDYYGVRAWADKRKLQVEIQCYPDKSYAVVEATDDGVVEFEPHNYSAECSAVLEAIGKLPVGEKGEALWR